MQTLSRRSFLVGVAGGCAWLTPAWLRAQTAGARRPNILLLIADDQGWGDLSIHDNTNLRTPQLDALAGEGARLNHF